MSEFQFQQALARFLTDKCFREKVRLRQFDELAREEEIPKVILQQLESMNAERTEIYSELLVTNRLSKAIEALPWSTTLLGEHLWQVAQAFNQACPPIYAKKYLEAMTFASYLLSRVIQESLYPKYLEDIILYEMNSLELRFEFDGKWLPDLESETPQLLQRLIISGNCTDIIPHQLSHSRVLSLNFDIERIIEELSQGSYPTDVNTCSKFILMYVDSTGTLQKLDINPPTAAFLALTDGQAPLTEIITCLAEVFEQNEPSMFTVFTQRCISLCETLIERKIIGLSKTHSATYPELCLKTLVRS